MLLGQCFSPCSFIVMLKVRELYFGPRCQLAAGSDSVIQFVLYFGSFYLVHTGYNTHSFVLQYMEDSIEGVG